jgi:hypothetical protein
MSSWDHGEALKLKVHGNDYARKVWLATAPPPGVGGRPREGDDIDVFKRFVVDAYERRRYYREPDSSGGGSDGKDRGSDVVGAAGKGTTVRSSMPSSAPATALNAPPVHTPPTVAPAAVVDLLDFGAFDTPASVVNSTSTAASTSDAFFDPFNDNSATMATDASSQSTSAAATSSNNNNINTNGNISANFDAFSPSMNGTSMANNISSMQSSKNSVPDPFSVLAGTSAVPTNSWGMMPMNPNIVSNFNNSSNNMMNGGTPSFANNNMMMMSGSGIQNDGNATMMNGNYNVMNSSPAKMMNGSFNSMMHNGGGVNAAVMNPMMPPTMAMPANMQQQYPHQQPPQSTIMNSHAGTSMFNSNSISNNFSTGTTGNTKTAATSSASAKPDPFAGLMGL